MRNGSKTLTSSFLPKLLILILETYKYKNHLISFQSPLLIYPYFYFFFLYIYKCRIYPGQKGKYAWVHDKSVYVYLAMTCLVARRTRRACMFSYITTSDFILELKTIPSLSAKLIWVQSTRPAYAEEISLLAYLTLMSAPIGGRQIAQTLLLSPRSFCFDLHKPCVKKKREGSHRLRICHAGDRLSTGSLSKRWQPWLGMVSPHSN